MTDQDRAIELDVFIRKELASLSDEDVASVRVELDRLFILFGALEKLKVPPSTEPAAHFDPASGWTA